MNVGVAKVGVILCLHLRRETSQLPLLSHHVQVGIILMEMIGKLVFKKTIQSKQTIW